MILQRRIWRVVYGETPLYLTYEEYDELKRLALDDPVAAAAKARQYLDREVEATP